MRVLTVFHSRMTHSPLVRLASRWLFGTAGIMWIAIAATLCGCSPISPVNGWVMNESGKAYYRRGDYRAARYEFERALMDRPQSADYAYNVAAAMDQQGDDLSAEKMYRHALTLDPGHQPSYHGLAAMMVDGGRTDEASDLITTWSATQPYSAEATTELGWLKAEQGDSDGADREYRRALRQNPRHSRARTELARLYGKTGRRGEAAAEYARSLFMDPEQPDAQAELASLGQSVYGDPALQMAAAMPVYDPSMQPNPYPAFTASATQPQLASGFSNPSTWPGATVPAPQMGASSPWGTMSYSPAEMASPPPHQTSVAASEFTHPVNSGMAPAPVMANPQAAWGQSPAYVNSPQSYSTNPYPDIVTQPYLNPQSHLTARAGSSFFQPQQTFSGMPSQGAFGGTPVPMPDSGYQITSGNAVPMPAPASGGSSPYSNDAPYWNQPSATPPTIVPTANWSAPSGPNFFPSPSQSVTPIPVPQISSAPVVPAF